MFTYWPLAQIGSLFLAPAFAAAGLLAVSIPIALHLLRRQRQRHVVWGAMRFLREAVEQERRKLLISQWLLLLLRCLVVLLLGLALAQPLLAGWFSSAGSRQVHLVIDDGLTTRAVGGDGQERFETLRREAIDLVNGLRSSDDLTIWTLTGGSSTSYQLSDGGREQAIEELHALSSSDAATSPVGVMAEVLRSPGMGAAETIGVVLSDLAVADSRWAGDVSASDDPNPRWRWVVRRAESSLRNDQVASLVASQSAVVPQAGGRALMISVEAELTRLGGEPVDETAELVWRVLDEAGRELMVVSQAVRLEAGDERRMVRQILTLPVDMLTRDSQRLLIESRWVQSASRLSSDDVAMTAVEVRRSATVLIQHTAVPGLTAARWFALALEPVADDENPLRAVLIQRLSEQALGDADVLVLTEPGALDASEQAAVRRWLEGGRSAVLLPPGDATDGLWSGGLGLPERVYGGVEQREDSGAALDQSVEPRGLLAGLSAEWPTLARTVRVFRWTPIVVPGVRPLVMLGSASASPWLAEYATGGGRVVLMASRLESDWTNLPVKPLAVPLIQTLIRDLISSRMAVEQRVVGASEMDVSDVWVRQGAGFAEDIGVAPDRRSGWYVSAGEEGRWLIARPATQAGDLSAATPARIESFLPGEVVWVESGGVGGALEEAESRSAIGPLVLVMALLVLLSELVVARWSSTGERRWW
ncbi:MAG: BatA domain-containing protein [Phycisphaeraceae bacterium]